MPFDRNRNYVNWNPWHGCTKVSEGCRHCYVYRQDAMRDSALDSSSVHRNADFDLPVRRNRRRAWKIPAGSVVFTCFTSDFLLEEADCWRAEAWDMIRMRRDLIFYFFTKRIERFAEVVPEDWGDGWDNVAIAVSCENQEMADLRLPILLDAKIRHKLIFVAPILEYVELDGYLKSGQIEQVAVGGESYAGARTCDFDWVRGIREVCLKNNVVFDFHQTGSNFVKDGRRYYIKHRDEHSQARKGMIYLDDLDKKQ